MASSRRAAVVGALPGAGNRGDRSVCLDNLKVVLIAAIIAMHAVVGYSTLEVWTYSGLREVTLHPAVEAGLILVVLPFGLVLMALFFLVAGLLSVPSVRRKGPGRFARDRLVRLGIPFLGYVLLIQPVTVYALEHPLGGAPGSFWEEFLGDEGVLDSGPLWFVGALLVYSLAYAAWVRLRAGTHAPGSAKRFNRRQRMGESVGPAVARRSFRSPQQIDESPRGAQFDGTALAHATACACHQCHPACQTLHAPLLVARPAPFCAAVRHRRQVRRVFRSGT